ncbi:cation:proton antiporter [Nocardioides sp.]|uniref:cation:proton antiporter n=1 Tax=Nocardioides sp. TaxID=35761 RepID=UPI003D11C481
MSFAQLSVVCLIALLGPVLALGATWRLPVVLGELLGGLVLGQSLLGYLDPGDPTFTVLADIGFALVMFVVGSHVPVTDPSLRPALGVGVLRALAVGVASALLGCLLAAAFDVPHAALYAVLMASSSAALILPALDSTGLTGKPVLELLPQVAIADAACIVALPLVLEPANAWRAAGGTAAVIAATLLVFWLLRHFERNGARAKVHDLSEERDFALELRVQLALLFGLGALAVWLHTSILLAGFAFGLAVAAVGEPRRLAKQLFALTEGFFGPLFFVWLGASLDLRALAEHPRLILLGVCLGVGACLAHLVGRLLGQPVPLALLASAQLGVPVAAAKVGTELGVLVPGEAAALMLGALVAITVAVLGGVRLAGRLPGVGTGA